MLEVAAAAMLVTAAATTAVPAQAAPGQAWVEMAPGGGSVVRALTDAEACPVLHVDGRAVPMAERAAPATLPSASRASSAVSRLRSGGDGCADSDMQPS